MRKFLKKLTALALILTTCLAVFASCSEEPYDYGYDGEFNPYPYKDLSVFMELPDYKNLTVSQTALDDMMRIEIYSFCSENALTYEVTDGAAQRGDTVSVFYVAYEGYGTDPQSIEELSYRRYDEYSFPAEIYLGIGEMPFEDGIVGVKAGETKSIEVTLPQDYPYPQHRGKTVTFVVELDKIVRAPDLTDEMCKTYAGFDSKAEFLEKLKSNCIFDFAWQSLMGKCTLKGYPNTEYTQYYQQYYTMIEALAEASEMPLADFIAKKGGYYTSYGLWYGMTTADLRAVAQDYAESNVVNDLLTYSLMRAEGIKLSGAEWDAAVAEFEKEMGLTWAQIVSRTSEIEAIISVLMIRISQVILNNVTITNE